MAFSVSIILPVINETFSLEQTVKIIAAENSEDISEYVIVIGKKTEEKSLITIKELRAKYGSKIVVLNQKLPFLGGAIRDAFNVCIGSQVIMMASDLETDPHLVKELIKFSRQDASAVITSTRWKTKGGFKGYNPLKLLLNKVFQSVFSILYRTSLSDMTYGYRLFPTELVRSINWEELGHPFLFETIIKPLKLGVSIVEIPTKWEARKEGKSQNTFFKNFGYFAVGIKGLIRSKKRYLKNYS